MYLFWCIVASDFLGASEFCVSYLLPYFITFYRNLLLLFFHYKYTALKGVVQPFELRCPHCYYFAIIDSNSRIAQRYDTKILLYKKNMLNFIRVILHVLRT